MSTTGLRLETVGAASRRSPFRDVFEDASIQIAEAASVAELDGGLALAPLDTRGLLDMRGPNIAEALGLHLSRPGEAQMHGGSLIAQLRPDRWLALTRTRDPMPAFSGLVAAHRAGRLVTLTDISHGRASLLLIGGRALEILSRVCALNFGERVFPHAHAAQASLAKVKSLIIRWDLGHVPAFFIAVERSVARYSARAILTEMEELQPKIWKTGDVLEAWPAARAADASQRGPE